MSAKLPRVPASLVEKKDHPWNVYRKIFGDYMDLIDIISYKKNKGETQLKRTKTATGCKWMNAVIRNEQNSSYDGHIMTVKHLRVTGFIGCAQGYNYAKMIETVFKFFTEMKIPKPENFDIQALFVNYLKFFKLYLVYLPRSTKADNTIKFITSKDAYYLSEESIVSTNPEWVLAEQDLHFQANGNCNFDISCDLSRNLRPGDTIWLCAAMMLDSWFDYKTCFVKLPITYEVTYVSRI